MAKDFILALKKGTYDRSTKYWSNKVWVNKYDHPKVQTLETGDLLTIEGDTRVYRITGITRMQKAIYPPIPGDNYELTIAPEEVDEEVDE